MAPPARYIDAFFNMHGQKVNARFERSQKAAALLQV
jgi:hypothetical protein